MKNLLKLSTILVIVLAGAGSAVLRSAARNITPNETALTGASASRALYLNNCGRCHGADGKAETELGRLNDTPDISGGRARRLSVAQLNGLIGRGKGSMPGFGKKLTRAQIAGLANYVRRL